MLSGNEFQIVGAATLQALSRKLMYEMELLVSWHERNKRDGTFHVIVILYQLIFTSLIHTLLSWFYTHRFVRMSCP